MRLNRETKKPSKAGALLVDRLSKFENYTIELGKAYLERVFRPMPVGDDLADSIEAGIESSYQEVRRLQKELGLAEEVIALGTPPNLDNSDLKDHWLSEGSRFEELNQYALNTRGGKISVEMTTKEQNKVKFSFPEIPPWFASLQINVQPENREDLLSLANIHTAFAGLCLAPTVASPFFAKQALDKESRIGIYTQAWELGRVGFYGHIKSLQEYFAKTLLFAPALTEIIEGESVLDLPNLNQHANSIHPWNRIKTQEKAGKIVEWLEIRETSAVPAAHDNAANVVLKLGLIFGLLVEMKAGVFTDLDLMQHIESKQNELDFKAVATDGLEAKVIVPGFDRALPLSQQSERFIQLCGKGLLYLGMDGEKTKRFLKSLKARLTSGITEADWMLKRKEKLEELGVENVWEELISELLQCAEGNIPVHEREI
ncbi:MAG: hypothetical protein R3A13_03565 [Bdellovibrionota bacterium]